MTETNIYFKVDSLNLDPSVLIMSIIEDNGVVSKNVERIPCATWEQANWLKNVLQEAHDRVAFQFFICNYVDKILDGTV